MKKWYRSIKKNHMKKSKFRMLIFTNNETKHSTVTASIHTQYSDWIKKKVKFGDIA